MKVPGLVFVVVGVVLEVKREIGRNGRAGLGSFVVKLGTVQKLVFESTCYYQVLPAHLEFIPL